MEQTLPSLAKSQPKSPFSRPKSPMSSRRKQLTLRQVKDLIFEISVSKQKRDLNKLKARETMSQHLTTFFQTKYGLRQIAQEQAVMFKQAINQYQQDIEVGLFS